MRILPALVLGAAIGFLAGCNGPGHRPSGADGLAFREPASTTYEEAAARFNGNAARLQRLWANAVVRIAFTDDRGERRQEQGEGRVQIVQPDRVALNIGKLGETYIWIGCDANRYWLLDLSGSEHIGFAGRHAGYETSRARSFGVVVPPLEIITLLGIRPIPDRGGAIQVSGDGRLIGLTSRVADGAGRQRVWLDARSGLPVQIELFGGGPGAEVVASLSEHQTVAIRGSGELPSLATRVVIGHAASESLVTLDLTDMEDGADRVRAEAFSLGTLLRQMRVDKLYDLDTPRSATGQIIPPTPSRSDSR